MDKTGLCAIFAFRTDLLCPEKAAGEANKHLGLAVEIKALFDESRGSIAGKRTLKARLKSKGIEVGLALIRQLMKQQGLVSKQPQKRWRTGTSEQASTLFNNVLNRQFSPCADTTVLCGDTTYLKVQGEWHYLAIVMNLAQRQVVG